VLVTASIPLASVNVFATTNHPPTVSWITDQAITSGTGFEQVYFRAWDNETPIALGDLSFSVQNLTPNFYTGIVHIDNCTSGDNGCPQDGTGFKLNFDSVSGDGAATIWITATDGGGASAASSFTLRKQTAAVYPPTVAGVSKEQIQKGSTLGYGPVWFVVDDLNTNGIDDAIGLNGDSTVTYSVASSNPAVVAVDDVQLTPPTNGLKWSLKVAPNPNNIAGRAVITITFTDQQQPVHFSTSTSFVLDVIDSTKTPPSFSPSDTFIEHDVTGPTSITYNFRVTDSETPKNQLLVTATSSNANLVPNDSDHLLCSTPASNGTGTVTITPMLPLPSPSPGVPQAATITLAVTDDNYTRRKQFLYVAKDSTSKALSFSRPTGVWDLDPPDHHPDDPFLTGEMRRISWKDIDNGGQPETWNWSSLDGAYTEVYNQGRDLSLNLIEEPCYVAQGATYTWCDTSRDNNGCTSCSGDHTLRALP
jgi:hypothetical protein